MIASIRSSPYIRGIKRLFLGKGTLQSASYRQEVLCAPESAPLRPAIFTEGQLEKIIGTDDDTTLEIEIAVATAQTTIHAPTIAFHIKNAVLFDGCIYHGSLKYLLSDHARPKARRAEPRELKTVALASSYLGCKYFGHWLADDCLQYQLALDYGQPLCLWRPTYQDHHEKYQAFLDQDWSPIDTARIDHLVVYQDFAQNSLKRARLQLLRDRVRGRFPSGGSGSLVYIRRGASGVRRIVENEDEILETLVKRGFLIVDIESDSLERILEVLGGAKLVVSLEGSHCTHGIFSLPENSGLIVLQPPDRFLSWNRGWSECGNVRFGFVVGNVREAGYHFPISDILQTVDLMLKSIESG